MPKPPALPENPLPDPAPPAASPVDAVEDELNAMIGEARRIIGDFIIPSGMQCTGRNDRIAFFDEAMHLMTAASKIGDTIARLRGGGFTETRHRMVFEHMTKTGTPPGSEK